jgi:hypothetical protein
VTTTSELEILPAFATPKFQKLIEALNGPDETAREEAVEELQAWAPEYPYKNAAKDPDFFAEDDDERFGDLGYVRVLAYGPFEAFQDDMLCTDATLLEKVALVVTDCGSVGVADTAKLSSLQPQFDASLTLAAAGRCVISTSDGIGWFDFALARKLRKAGHHVTQADCGFGHDHAEKFERGKSRVLMLAMQMHEKSSFRSLASFPGVGIECGEVRHAPV